MTKQFRSFEDAKKFVQLQNLQTKTEWATYCKSGKKPDDIPSNPELNYKKYWTNWGDWLRNGKSITMKNKFLSFEDAKKFVHSLNLKSVNELRQYQKYGKKPNNIPSSPNQVYDQWISWGDWLGTGRISTDKKQYRSFQNARNFIRTQKLMNNKEWRKFAKSKDFPADIPASPEKVYKNKGWNGLGDFLGTGNIAFYNRTYLSFQDAKKFVQSLGLKSQNEWNEYCKSGNKPDDIPQSARTIYKKEWKNMGDWLGTGRIADQLKQYRSYDEAKKIANSLKLKSNLEWQKFCSDNKPYDVPVRPDNTYKNKGWTTWGDFLGTGTIAPQNREFRSFEDAREFVRKLKLSGQKDWTEYCKLGNNPKDIPSNPNQVYKKEWKNMGDWLGTGNISDRYKVFRPYKDAREFVRALNLKGRKGWIEYCESGNKPDDIPTTPWVVYKEWKK